MTSPRPRRPLGGPQFLFATGVENSYPTVRDAVGRPVRVDGMAKCGHCRHWRTDFALVEEVGANVLRYGPPIHTTWLADGRYDRAFAERFPWVQFYTPVNETYVATFSAYYGWWNEQLRSERAAVTALKHLVRANVLAMHAILELRPDAIFVQSESSEYFHAAIPAAIGPAEMYNEGRFLSLGLNYGRRVSSSMYELLLDSGGMTREEYHQFLGHQLRHHCVLGTDYYATSEHLVHEDARTEASGEIFGYAVLAGQYHPRYGLPVMHPETNLAEGPGGDEAVRWLRKQWANVLRVRNDGVPVLGLTWYSLTDQVDRDAALREDNGRVNPLGLCDLDRRPRAVGRAYQALIGAWQDVLPTRSLVLGLPAYPPSQQDDPLLRELRTAARGADGRPARPGARALFARRPAGSTS